MYCNDLKCGDNVDFCYITKTFCSMKVFFFSGGGAMWAYVGPLVQKIRIWVVMELNGVEMDSMTPKTPDIMYHTSYFMKNIQNV